MGRGVKAYAGGALRGLTPASVSLSRQIDLAEPSKHSFLRNTSRPNTPVVGRAIGRSASTRMKCSRLAAGTSSSQSSRKVAKVVPFYRYWLIYERDRMACTQSASRRSWLLLHKRQAGTGRDRSPRCTCALTSSRSIDGGDPGNFANQQEGPWRRNRRCPMLVVDGN